MFNMEKKINRLKLVLLTIKVCPKPKPKEPGTRGDGEKIMQEVSCEAKPCPQSSLHCHHNRVTSCKTI